MPQITELLAVESLPIWLITIALLWSLSWKGLALWKSARKNSPIWFVFLLVVNTLGIFEILYIFLFSEIKLPKIKGKKRSRKKKSKN